MSSTPELHLTRYLHGPGPSDCDPRVLQALANPTVGHLDPDFLKIMADVQRLMRMVWQTENEMTFPISGTGTSGMETAIANLVEPGDPVLVCVAGYFGERLVEIATRYGGDVARIDCGWGEVFSASQVADALRQRSAKLVAIVQAETSTGVLQPISEITKLVHDAGALLLVDAVTSLGGVGVSVDQNQIDAAYSCTQKCLSAPSGLSPFTFGPRAVEKLKNRKDKVHSFYLDLNLLQQYWGPAHVYHHTAPINMIFALDEALHLIEQEGLEARIARHRANAELLWDSLTRLGLSMHVPLKHRLPSLTTVRVPEGVDEGTVRKRLLQEYNIEIGAGLGALKGKVWRVGLMGYASTPERVAMLLEALENVLHSS
ncbi:MAG: pyridoxal-phosphate-dependent aminotransferase family protein [Aggregatilineales bacterium]